MKILSVLGARPQFIKAATVNQAIRSHNQNNTHQIEEIIVHTGQHFDANMSDIFFEELQIPSPNYNLGIASLNHGAMTGRMLEGIESLIQKEQPDWMLVYGDTNSTLAGSLAAIKLKIPVAHVEAGLRSNNLAMPEEINRILTDRVSKVLFCPTQTAVNNLSAEGFPFYFSNQNRQHLYNVGDVMYDAALYYAQKAKDNIHLEQWNLKEKQYVLCTIHRAENTDHPKKLSSVFNALQQINQHIPVVLPLHPRTYKTLSKYNHNDWLKQYILLQPVSYLKMQRLEMGAKVILTDSGGVQKEAFFHRTPCITLRDETEWTETVELGFNKIVGTDEKAILKAFNSLNSIDEVINNPYGDGTASKKIVKTLLDLYVAKKDQKICAES